MTAPDVTPDCLRRIVGALPTEGHVRADPGYPYETVTPARDGYTRRGNVNLYFALWGDRGPTIVVAAPYQMVHMQYLKAIVPYLSRHFQVVTIDQRGTGRSSRARRLLRSGSGAGRPEHMHGAGCYQTPVPLLPAAAPRRAAATRPAPAPQLRSRLCGPLQRRDAGRAGSHCSHDAPQPGLPPTGGERRCDLRCAHRGSCVE